MSTCDAVSWIHCVIDTPCHGYTVSWVHRVMDTPCRGNTVCDISHWSVLPARQLENVAFCLQATYTDLYVPKRPRSSSHPDLSNLANSNSQQKGNLPMSSSQQSLGKSPSQQSLGKSPSQQSLSKSSSQQTLASPDKAEAGHNKIPKSPAPKQQTADE